MTPTGILSEQEGRPSRAEAAAKALEDADAQAQGLATSDDATNLAVTALRMARDDAALGTVTLSKVPNQASIYLKWLKENAS